MRTLRTLRGNPSQVFHMEMVIGGESVAYSLRATPDTLTLEAKAGVVKICIPEPGVIRVHGERAGLHLTLVATGICDNALPDADDCIVPNNIYSRQKGASSL